LVEKKFLWVSYTLLAMRTKKKLFVTALKGLTAEGEGMGWGKTSQGIPVTDCENKKTEGETGLIGKKIAPNVQTAKHRSSERLHPNQVASKSSGTLTGKKQGGESRCQNTGWIKED